ncbi:PcfK-like family protein [Dysgonomonas sp. Marseille-P4361]|uniref:PcfK-like family protein n=1 Tax=Dysgonomonas sp. Marseille-P4361 TaxID=2161820 RepID=UPI000D5571D1|nr:PcfK-like family protein [Dysgonomonas sp. Marseille-P4361]
MKASNHFKNTIKAYLDQRAETDVLFLLQYSKPEKNIDDCITYIFNEVKKSGCNGFADDEIYNMAVHFYDKDNIEIGMPMSNAHVVVNHFVELTEEEKEQARQDAIQKAQDEAYRKMTQPVKKTKKIALTPQLDATHSISM